jgi:tetratricopeptide (TPR) repeat protein
MCFDKAEETKSNAFIVYLNRGECKYAFRKYHDAIDDFNKVEGSEHESHKYNNIGLCYYQLGRYEEARNDYLKSSPIIWQFIAIGIIPVLDYYSSRVML